MHEQTTSAPPNSINVSIAADILKRNHQLIFVLRETVTSFTASMLIDNEQRDTLRNTLIQLINQIRSIDGPLATIRVDPAPGFQALRNDEVLKSNHLF